jgi:hypothetical protein
MAFRIECLVSHAAHDRSNVRFAVPRPAFTTRHRLAGFCSRAAARASTRAGGAIGVAIALGACTQTVVLGTDCPVPGSVCTDETSSPVAGDTDPQEGGAKEGGAGSDRGEDAGEQTKDAQVETLPDLVLDAGPTELDAEAGTRALLSIQNPDFERSGGIGGDLVLRSLLGKWVPFPPVTLIFAELPGWYACWATTVHSVPREFDLDAGLMQPQDDYLTFVVTGPPVRQLLPTPMQAGARYALQMEVWGRADPGETLSVEILGAFHDPDAGMTDNKGPFPECEQGTRLGKSGPLPNNAGWTQTCIEFVADRAYPYLLIAPTTTRDPPSGTARLSLDGLRSVSSCVAPVPAPIADAGTGIR